MAADMKLPPKRVDDAARNRLGRGLAALIGDGDGVPTDDGVPGYRMMPVAFLAASSQNPRREFTDDALEDLANSIRSKGVVQPILVRPSSDSEERFEIIAGERRWRAAQRAGLHEIPVLIRRLDDQQALEVAIIENVQRADLNPIEEALGYRRLIDDFGYSQAALGDMIGKSRPHVANMLRLLTLPPAVLELVTAGKLSAGHARMLVGMDDPAAAARQVVESNMSVRDVESLARGGAPARARKREQPKGEKDADTLALERMLSDALGLVVTLTHHDKGGEVRIRYRSLDQLDHICRRLRGQ